MSVRKNTYGRVRSVAGINEGNHGKHGMTRKKNLVSLVPNLCFVERHWHAECTKREAELRGYAFQNWSFGTRVQLVSNPRT